MNPPFFNDPPFPHSLPYSRGIEINLKFFDIRMLETKFGYNPCDKVATYFVEIQDIQCTNTAVSKQNINSKQRLLQ